MSTLPELTDEQIDAAWEGMNPVRDSTMRGAANRSSNRWTALRAAFPAPKPPEPRWTMDFFTAGVRIDEGLIRVYLRQRDEGRRLLPDQAREMAAALVACADWIEANR